MPVNDSALARFPLFRDLDARQRRVLSQVLTERALEPGEALFRQGEPGLACAFVVFGDVEVVGDAGPGKPPRALATLGTGELVGEMALLDGAPRSAGCVAGPKGAAVAVLARDEFDLLFNAGNPFAYALMDLIAGQLARRLHGATELLRDAAVDEGATGA